MNESFNKVSEELKRKGIKNYDFMLETKNKEVIGLDPFNPKLTEKKKALIFKECHENIWYFFREVARVVGPCGDSQQFPLDLGSLAEIFCFVNNFNYISLKPRQCLSTLTKIALMSWATLMYSNIEGSIFAKKHDDSKDQLTKMYHFIDRLPEYFHRDFGTDNVTQRYNCQAKPAARGILVAESLGRGMTQNTIFFNDASFIPYIEKLIESSAPARKASELNARKNGLPYCTMIEGTLSAKKTREAIYIRGFKEMSSKFDIYMYDLEIDGLKEYLNKYSANGFLYIRYNFIALGKDPKWFSDVCKMMNNKSDSIQTELLLEEIW